MKTIGSGRRYIDYFQGLFAPQVGLSKCFGIRVGKRHLVVVVKLNSGEATVCGKEFCLPVEIEMLPSHVRQIVDDHVLNYPTSDLIDVLTGKKSFQQAVEFPTVRKNRTTNHRSERQRVSGMSSQPNWTDLSSELNQRRIDFLKADLAVCFTFAKVAETELGNGDRYVAAKAMSHAEKGYETICSFLADPKHVSHLTANQVQNFKAELQRLRERLDGLGGPELIVQIFE
jgi:hypothetical protein